MREGRVLEAETRLAAALFLSRGFARGDLSVGVALIARAQLSPPRARSRVCLQSSHSSHSDPVNIAGFDGKARRILTRYRYLVYAHNYHRMTRFPASQERLRLGSRELARRRLHSLSHCTHLAFAYDAHPDAPRLAIDEHALRWEAEAPDARNERGRRCARHSALELVFSRAQ